MEYILLSDISCSMFYFDGYYQITKLPSTEIVPIYIPT